MRCGVTALLLTYACLQAAVGKRTMMLVNRAGQCKSKPVMAMRFCPKPTKFLLENVAGLSADELACISHFCTLDKAICCETLEALRTQLMNKEAKSLKPEHLSKLLDAVGLSVDDNSKSTPSSSPPAAVDSQDGEELASPRDQTSIGLDEVDDIDDTYDGQVREWPKHEPSVSADKSESGDKSDDEVDVSSPIMPHSDAVGTLDEDAMPEPHLPQVRDEDVTPAEVAPHHEPEDDVSSSSGRVGQLDDSDPLASGKSIAATVQTDQCKMRPIMAVRFCLEPNHFLLENLAGLSLEELVCIARSCTAGKDQCCVTLAALHKDLRGKLGGSLKPDHRSKLRAAVGLSE